MAELVRKGSWVPIPPLRTNFATLPYPFKVSLPFRVNTVADGSDGETPVLVVVKHEKGVLSWQVSSYNFRRS